MKRVAGLVLLLALIGGSYAYWLAARESRYQSLIDEGDAALGRADTFAAIETFTVAISIKPDSMAAHLKRGEAYRRRKEYDAALRDLGRAAALDPLAPYPREILGDVNTALGRFSGAADQYRACLSIDDRSPRVQYKLGLAYLQLGQAGSAVRTLRQAIALDGRFAEAYYLLGVALQELRRPTEALGALLRSIDHNPALIPAREELAALYGRLERIDQQNRQLEALAALDPQPRREAALAISLARDGQLERGVLRLRNSARHGGGDADTDLAVGRVWLEHLALRGKGRPEVRQAIAALASATASNPTSEALTLYGRALMEADRITKAYGILVQATTRSPADPTAFYYLAEVAERRGRMKVAHRALIQYALLEGLDSRRLDAEVLARIAGAWLAEGNVSAAREAVERALRKDPASAMAIAVGERLR